MKMILVYLTLCLDLVQSSTSIDVASVSPLNEWAHDVQKQIAQINETFHTERSISTDWLNAFNNAFTVKNRHLTSFPTSLSNFTIIDSKTNTNQTHSRVNTSDSHSSVQKIDDIGSLEALDIILRLPLVRYKIQNDAKPETRTAASRDDIELRLTRNHVGVIELIKVDKSALDLHEKKIDYKALFAINLKAISHLDRVFSSYMQRCFELNSYLLSDSTGSLSERLTSLKEKVLHEEFITLADAINKYEAALVERDQGILALLGNKVHAESRSRILEAVFRSQIQRIKIQHDFTEHTSKVEAEAKISQEIDFLEMDFASDLEIEAMFKIGNLHREKIKLKRFVYLQLGN